MVIDDEILIPTALVPPEEIEEGVYFCLVRDDISDMSAWMAVQWTNGKWENPYLKGAWYVVGHVMMGDPGQAYRNLIDNQQTEPAVSR